MQRCLGSLGFTPTQADLAHVITLPDFAARCNLQMLRNLKAHLDELTERPEVGANLGVCRQEGQEVNRFFPRAAKLDHASFAAKIYCSRLPKELKNG